MPAPLLASILLFSGCHGPADTGLDRVFSSCDPLDPTLCALPFPSSFFLADDPETVTGLRVAFADDSLPADRDGVHWKPTYLNEKDGFSTVAPLLAWFPDLSLEGTAGHDDIGAYADPGALTMIVDASTGERVPHWVELDRRDDDPSQQLLVLQPAVPLRHATRYVVGIRGLVDTAGSPEAASTAFAALRDGTPTGTWDVEGRRQHFEDEVFPVLEEQGVAREELQLAWDFTTVSQQDSLGRLEWMREDALSRAGQGGPAYQVVSQEDADCSVEGTHIARTLTVSITEPLYTLEDKPGTHLSRDADGMPEYQGDTSSEMLVQVPCSVAAARQPSFLLEYGHGLLGDKDEARSGYLQELADEFGWVLWSMDWKGMSASDKGDIVLMTASDLTDFVMLPERIMQGWVEKLLGLELLRGDLAADPALTFDGSQVIDPDRIGYYGNSQGSVLGGGYVPFTREYRRATLGVAGAPFSVLLLRSNDFSAYLAIFDTRFADQRKILLNIALMETLWEPAEAGGWLREFNQEPTEGQPPVQALLQVAIGDAQVNTLGAEIMARSYGASTVWQQARPVWGVEERTAPFDGSALVEWTYTDVPDEPYEDLPPDVDHDPHECPRREPAAQEQMRTFLETGTVEQTCEDDYCGGHGREGICD